MDVPAPDSELIPQAAASGSTGASGSASTSTGGVDTAGEGASPRSPRLAHLGARAQRLGLVRLWGLWLTTGVVMFIFYGLNSAFLGGNNLLDLVRAASSLAIVAMGQTLVIVSGELDLSVGSVYALAPIVMGVLWMNHGVPVYLALVLALAAAALVGLVNGFLSAVTKIPSFVVTLGMLNLALGVAVLLGGSQYFTPNYAQHPLPKSQLSFFNGFGGSAPFGIPAQVIWLVGLAVLFALILHRSLFGFRLLAIGGNPDAAKVARLPVRTYRIAAFAVCAAMAGLAGLIDFSFLGSAQSSVTGSDITFPCFAAVIIGGASLTGGAGTIIGTLSGAILLQVLTAGLALIGVGAGWQLFFIGAITIVAVGIDRWAALGPLIREWVGTRLALRRVGDHVTP